MFWPSHDEAHYRIFGTKLLDKSAWASSGLAGEAQEEGQNQIGLAEL
jgi:hypothetical protein